MTQPEGPRTRSAAAAAATPDAEDSQDGTERLRVEVASLTDAHGDLLIAVRALQASVAEMQTSLAATAAENRALRAAQMADTALLRPGEATAPAMGVASAPTMGVAPAPTTGVAMAPATGEATAPVPGDRDGSQAGSALLAAAALARGTPLAPAAHAISIGAVAKFRPTLEIPDFYGSKDAPRVAQWLRNAELVFAASAMPAGDQVRTISTRLKGPALTWFIERLDRRGGIPFDSWEEFSAAIKKFVHHDVLQSVGRQRLRDFRQLPSQTAHEYYASFSDLCAQIDDLEPKHKVHAYLDGLRESTRVAVLTLHPTLPEDLAYLASEATRLEAVNAPLVRKTHALHAMEVTTPVDVRHPHGRGEAGRAAYLARRRSPLPSPAHALSTAELDRHFQLQLCFKCHEPGHTARQCTYEPHRPNVGGAQ